MINCPRDLITLWHATRVTNEYIEAHWVLGRMYYRSNQSNSDFRNDFNSGPFAPYGQMAGHIIEHFERFNITTSAATNTTTTTTTTTTPTTCTTTLQLLLLLLLLFQ